jgi:hypothetical protein
MKREEIVIRIEELLETESINNKFCEDFIACKVKQGLEVIDLDESLSIPEAYWIMLKFVETMPKTKLQERMMVNRYNDV